MGLHLWRGGRVVSGNWILRGGLFDLSIVPNSTDLDPGFGQFQSVGEIEHRHQLWGLPGKVAINGFLTRGRMGSFEDAILLAQITAGTADIAAVRRYNSRGGVSVLSCPMPAPKRSLRCNYQFVANPAYNCDRGPVSIIGTRLDAQF